MLTGVLADGLHGQGIAGLMGVDGLVLGAVVGEDAPDFLCPCDGGDVSMRKDQAHRAFDHVEEEGLLLPMISPAMKREHHKQADPKDQRERAGDDSVAPDIVKSGSSSFPTTSAEKKRARIPRPSESHSSGIPRKKGSC